jgi:hypothetical protein
MLVDQPLELAHQLTVPADREIGLHPLLDRRHP